MTSGRSLTGPLSLLSVIGFNMQWLGILGGGTSRRRGGSFHGFPGDLTVASATADAKPAAVPDCRRRISPENGQRNSTSIEPRPKSKLVFQRSGRPSAAQNYVIAWRCSTR